SCDKVSERATVPASFSPIYLTLPHKNLSKVTTEETPDTTKSAGGHSPLPIVVKTCYVLLLIATLMASLAKQLTVLLLRHTLATLLNNGAHKTSLNNQLFL